MPKTPEKPLSTKEASELIFSKTGLKVNFRSISRACKRGTIKNAYMFQNKWKIPRVDVLAYAGVA